MIRCDIENLTATPLFNHHRRHRATKQVNTFEIGANNALIIFQRLVQVVISHTGAPYPGIAHQDINAAKRLPGTVYDRSDKVRVRHIALPADRLNPFGLKRCNHVMNVIT